MERSTTGMRLGAATVAGAAVVALCLGGAGTAAAAPHGGKPPTSPRPTPTTSAPAPTTTAPAPTTTAPPTSTTTAGSQFWSSNFASAGLANFQDTPYNNVGASAPVLVDSSAIAAGGKALRFTMPAGGERSEVVPNTAEFGEGADRWFGFSVVLAPDFPTTVPTWQLITQWKNDGTGSPPLELDVNKGEFSLGGGYGYPGGPRLFRRSLGPATTGQRVDFTFHILFSRDPMKGVVDVYRDGALVAPGVRPPGGTLYPTSKKSTASLNSYWKMGIYRDKLITAPGVLTIESARIGNSAASVAPAP